MTVCYFFYSFCIHRSIREIKSIFYRLLKLESNNSEEISSKRDLAHHLILEIGHFPVLEQISPAILRPLRPRRN